MEDERRRFDDDEVGRLNVDDAYFDMKNFAITRAPWREHLPAALERSRQLYVLSPNRLDEQNAVEHLSKSSPIRGVGFACIAAGIWIDRITRLGMVKLANTAVRLFPWMDLESPVVLKAVEFLVRIFAVAVVEPKRLVLGVAGRCQAQRLVADWAECAPDPGELLPGGRSAPLDVNVIAPVAVVAF